jgi:hypothetical protein
MTRTHRWRAPPAARHARTTSSASSHAGTFCGKAACAEYRGGDCSATMKSGEHLASSRARKVSATPPRPTTRLSAMAERATVSATQLSPNCADLPLSIVRKTARPHQPSHLPFYTPPTTNTVSSFAILSDIIQAFHIQHAIALKSVTAASESQSEVQLEHGAVKVPTDMRNSAGLDGV